MTKIATNDRRAKNMTKKIVTIVEKKQYDTKIVTIGEPKNMTTTMSRMVKLSRTTILSKM